MGSKGRPGTATNLRCSLLFDALGSCCMADLPGPIAGVQQHEAQPVLDEFEPDVNERRFFFTSDVTSAKPTNKYGRSAPRPRKVRSHNFCQA